MSDVNPLPIGTPAFPGAGNHGHDDWPLCPTDLEWLANDNNLESYSIEMFGGKHELAKLLELRIGKNHGNVGIDICGGSNGEALQGLLSLGILDKALVTNANDLRFEQTKSRSDLYHLAGNLLLRPTWDEMHEWQEEYAPSGLALILHRPVGALQNLDPKFYERAATELVDMLQPGGVMIAQVPRRFEEYLEYGGECTTVTGLQARADVEEAVVYRRPIYPGHPYVIINKAVTIEGIA